MTFYFTRYVHSKSIKILILHYHELTGKIKEHEGKQYLTINNYMLDKVLKKIRETVGVIKFDDTKIWIETDDKLPD